MTTLTRDTVDAAIGAGSSVAALAHRFGVGERDPDLTRILWQLDQDHRIRLHADGRIGRYRQAPE